MRVASVANMKARLSEYLRASTRGPVLITRNGRAVAALVSVSDEEEIERLLLSHSPRLRAILRQARKRVRAGHRLSHQQVWAKTPRNGRRAS
ncbi:MAG TPA: type II toxin-antitoxin system Phd/YefM family antitoxin [Tepidisphaeraceae bacterium]|jgi:prevent-host-death family protein|nr:type II toxin-antitoxin system Phd/YefM family antitoxin [Tepidisphaeraceae bacterium]